MGRNFRAARVAQTAREYLTPMPLPSSILPRRDQIPKDPRPRLAPVWLRVMQRVPPADILTRPYPVQHTEPDARARRPRRTFRPTPIVHPEDQLRQDFFRDHPWELARPRVVVELDGRDAQRCDWSTGLQQPGMPLSGESVVQRQLWLMEHAGMTKEKAYDEARREFYKLRQLEDIERRIAKEEAQMVGAYFGMSANRVSMGLEDKVHEHWKTWAEKMMAKVEAVNNQAYTSFLPNEDDGELLGAADGAADGAAEQDQGGGLGP